MKKRFSELQRPLIVGSLRQRTVGAVIEDIQKSEADGARAFILHIQLMNDDCRNYTSFKDIASATECPIMAINYRTKNGPGDEKRLEDIYEAVRAGFKSVDIPIYLFDDDPKSSLEKCDLPFAKMNPDEVSMRPMVIERQKKLIREFQNMGVEVLMSAHIGVELNMEQAVSLAMEIQRRDPDIVKIVAKCNSNEQMLEILRTNIEMERQLRTPFLYICQGEHGKLERLLAPLFGSMLIFGHHEYQELSNRGKQIINEITQFFKIVGVRNEDG